MLSGDADGLTVSVAACDATFELTWFEPRARYSSPDCDGVTAFSVNVAGVAPAMLVNVIPPLVETCHWIVGAGLPENATVKLAPAPGLTV
jgi:hypothetical protein